MFSRKMFKNPTFKDLQGNSSKENIKRYLDELTFDQAITFLQERIKKSFEDMEEEERKKEHKEALLKKVKHQIKSLYKENSYLRDHNFSLNKKYLFYLSNCFFRLKRNKGKIKTIQKIKKERIIQRKEIEAKIKVLEGYVNSKQEIIRRNGLMKFWDVTEDGRQKSEERRKKLRKKSPRKKMSLKGPSEEEYRILKIQALERMVERASPEKKLGFYGSKINTTSSYKKRKKFRNVDDTPLQVGFSEVDLEMDDMLAEEVIKLLEEEKTKIKESDEYGDLQESESSSDSLDDSDSEKSDKSKKSYVNKKTKINQLDREKQKLQIRTKLKKSKDVDIFVSRRVEIKEDEFGFEVKNDIANPDLMFEDVRKLEIPDPIDSDDSLNDEDDDEGRGIIFTINE